MGYIYVSRRHVDRLLRNNANDEIGGEVYYAMVSELDRTPMRPKVCTYMREG